MVKSTVQSSALRFQGKMKKKDKVFHKESLPRKKISDQFKPKTKGSF